MMTKTRLILIAGGSILFAGLLLLGGLFLINRMATHDGLTTAQKQAIFKKIIENNPSNVLSSNKAGSQSREAMTVADAASSFYSPLVYSPANREYKYRFSKTTYSKGSAADKCKSLNYDEFLATSESYEYYGDNNESYYKYIQFDSSNTVYSYGLNTYDSRESVSIDYRGGSYAVRTSYIADIARDGVAPEVTTPEETTDEPEDVEQEVDYVSLIEQYFGSDADIVDVVNENGKEYYVIQYSFQTDCSGNLIALSSRDIYNPAQMPDKIFVQSYIDSENFEIYRSYNYLSNVDPSNLVNSNVTELETGNEMPVDKFKFEYNVEIRDLVYPEYTPEKEANKIADYLATQNLNILFANNWVLQSVYSPDMANNSNDPLNYYSDRDFYPGGANGDKMYELSRSAYGLGDVAFLSSSSMLNDQYLTIEIFNLNKDLSNVTEKLSNTKSIDLNIEGILVPATQNVYTGDYSLMYDSPSVSSNSSSMTVPETYSRTEVILEYKGYKYKFSLPEGTGDISSIEFTELNTQNSADMNLIRQNLITALTSVGRGSDGSSGVNVSEPAPEKPI